MDSDKDDMDTEMIVYDNAFDTLSSCEQSYQKFKATTGKEVFALFAQFQTDGVDMNKIDLLIMQKSKLFFQLEKKKGMHINMAGLIHTEEESVNGWINRSAKDIKFRKPKTYAELETWDNGHTYECFHNLDIEVINAEIRALHFSAHLFYKRSQDQNVVSHSRFCHCKKLRVFKDWQTQQHIYAKTKQL